MFDLNGLAPLIQTQQRLVALLRDCNLTTARYGLGLSQPQMLELAERQAQALKATGRIEFGAGPYPKLIEAFCDSPYLTQEAYADTLAELCEMFYHLKNESAGLWSDDELIEAMKRLYDGRCHGSIERMSDRLWQALKRRDEDGEEEEQFDE